MPSYFGGRTGLRRIFPQYSLPVLALLAALIMLIPPTFTRSGPSVASASPYSHTSLQGNYHPAHALIISPTLAYSSFLGGNGVEIAYGIVVDSQGYIYVAGYTSADNFPVMNPIQPTRGGGADAFVAKLTPDGSQLVYSTYLGGSSTDMANALAVDTAGNAYVVGRTDSSNFPTVNPVQPELRGFGDGFVAKINPTGTALVYSTFLGGTTFGSFDAAYGVAADAQGNAYVTGKTFGPDFPVVNAIQPEYGGGGGDAYVAKFNPNGSQLVYSTYLGGGEGFSGTDMGEGIAVDGESNVYVTGHTTSFDFPIVNAIQPEYGGGEQDAFVTKINAAGSAIVYSTYLGGNDVFGDFGRAITTDSAGNAYVTGQISCPDFPTTPGAFQPTQPGIFSFSAFVTKFNPSGSALVYSTYLGGSTGGSDNGTGIAVDSDGSVYVGGIASTTDFPTLNAFQPHRAGSTDIFITKFNPSGSTLAYSTYLGGSGQDEGHALAFRNGNAYLTGYSFSSNFPIVNPFQPTLGGSFDGFVARISETQGATSTPTNTPTNTPTAQPSATVTATTTSVNTTTNTSTPVPTFTITLIPTNTATNTPTTPPLPTDTPTTVHTATTVPTATSTFTLTPTPCGITFSDIHPSDYFYDSVNYLACRGVISGYSDGFEPALRVANVFRPYNSTTRGQMCKIVVLARGWEVHCPPVPHFSDVPGSDPFYCYIETALEHEVVIGYADGTFRPYNNITRAQLCKFVVLMMDWTPICPANAHFSDVPTDNPFFCFVETAYEHDAIAGYADGTFRPGGIGTRGQICKIVYNAIIVP